jgi:hypothetical protein
MMPLAPPLNVPQCQGSPMPDYLNFAAKLLDLDPRELEMRLQEQNEKLQNAMTRLKEAEKAPGNLFERVVSRLPLP